MRYYRVNPGDRRILALIWAVLMCWASCNHLPSLRCFIYVQGNHRMMCIPDICAVTLISRSAWQKRPNWIALLKDTVSLNSSFSKLFKCSRIIAHNVLIFFKRMRRNEWWLVRQRYMYTMQGFSENIAYSHGLKPRLRQLSKSVTWCYLVVAENNI